MTVSACSLRDLNTIVFAVELGKALAGRLFMCLESSEEVKALYRRAATNAVLAKDCKTNSEASIGFHSQESIE